MISDKMPTQSEPLGGGVVPQSSNETTETNHTARDLGWIRNGILPYNIEGEKQ